MIEFSGDLSDKCKRYIQKSETKIATFSVLIVAIMFSIPLIIFTIIWDWIFVIGIPALALIVILVSNPKLNSPLKALNLYLPKKITIKGDTISIESEKTSANRSIINVKKVIDEGEWFHIIFCFGHGGGYFICQKNLIMKGTIEEFENLFKDKIIRNH